MGPHNLLDLQQAMKHNILGADNAELLAAQLLDGGDIAAVKRIQIHQNNYKQSLVGALGGIFPATKAFVGDAFLDGALGEFVLNTPPKGAALSEYGSEFADFFRAHAAAKNLPYLADLLRLEWALHSLQQINEQSLDAVEYLDGFDIALNPNSLVVNSDYPLMSLWSVATGQLPPEAVHIEQGGQTVVAMLTNGEVRLLSLNDQEAEFLGDLKDKRPRDDAPEVEAALLKKSILVSR